VSSVSSQTVEKVIECDRFKSEGEETEIAGKGHLKYFSLFKKGNRVHPLRYGPVVPHLPEYAANEAGSDSADKMTCKAIFKICHERPVSEGIINGVYDKNSKDPGAGKKIPRKDKGQKHDRNAKGDGIERVLADPEGLYVNFSDKNMDQRFGKTDRGNDRAVCEKVSSVALHRIYGEIYIVPVLEAYIDQLKETPESAGNYDKGNNVLVQH